MQEELLNLCALQDHLPVFMRHEFLNTATHGNLLGQLSTLNNSFVPILDYLTCYKSEVGLCLQRMVESYNLLIMMQFEGFFTTENAKTREFNEKTKKLDILTAETSAQKREQDTKEDMINTLLASKDVQIREQKARIEALEAQMDDIHEYVQKSKLDPGDPLS